MKGKLQLLALCVVVTIVTFICTFFYAVNDEGGYVNPVLLSFADTYVTVVVGPTQMLLRFAGWKGGFGLLLTSMFMGSCINATGFYLLLYLFRAWRAPHHPTPLFPNFRKRDPQ